jgi:DNA-binding response OmpR family regulator
VQDAQSSVLVVDDNELSRNMLLNCLVRADYLVALAEHGRTAMDMMQVERFDIVLLDLMMPEMNGYAVLECMKSSSTLRKTPVIVLSGTNTRDSVVRCLELGAHDYLVKPVQPATVKMRVWRCLEGRRIAQRSKLDDCTQLSSGAHVLVVDDEELNRDLLAERLRQADCTPTCVQGASQALEYLNRQPFDLIMLDIMMPEIDGLELLRRLKANNQFSGIPVIMVTAVDDSNQVNQSFELGAADYITKPFNAVDLTARLRSCVRLKRLQEEEAEHRRHLDNLASVGRTITLPERAGP